MGREGSAGAIDMPPRARRPAIGPGLRAGAAIGLVLAGLLPHPACCQAAPVDLSLIRSATGSRVEAMTILGGDFALAGGYYKFSGRSQTTMDVSKFGGAGDVGEPEKLGDLNVAWQPRLQGSMGFVDATSDIRSGALKGGTNRFRTFAIQLGAGARFWLTDHLSLAPTLTGMYGHTSNEYAPTGAVAPASLNQASQLGLVGWDENTWTVRPALNVQYVFTWDRTIVTLSSDPALFHTESFSSSNENEFVNGESASLVNKLDVDIPLGRQLYGHELRTGGYFSRTDLYGDLRDGLDTQHLYEVHGRLVLDFLNQFWKVQWMGIGGSYLWGSNFTGWTVGADVLFRF
jgi:hypothetical protein